MTVSISTEALCVKLTSSEHDHHKLSSHNDVKLVIVSLTSTPLPVNYLAINAQDVNESKIWSTTLSSIINLLSIKANPIKISLTKNEFASNNISPSTENTGLKTVHEEMHSLSKVPIRKSLYSCSGSWHHFEICMEVQRADAWRRDWLLVGSKKCL